MSKPKKEYDNISAKLIEYHNTEVVPIVKKYLSYGGGIKLKRQRVLLKRDQLESGTKTSYGYKEKYDHSFTVEYMVLNQFVINFLSKDEQDAFMELFESKNENNCIMGANMMYSLVEAKKEEIKTKLNGHI